MPLDSTAEIDALASAIAARPPRPSRWSMAGRMHAAVCVPVHFGSRGLEIWAIKRTAALRDHAREIAFPGGKPDDGDRDLADTALRETEEELGIARGQMRILAPLPAVPTATSNFALNPFVTLIDRHAVARPDAGEVAALIRMPVADFFSGRVPYRAVRLPGGALSPIFVFEVGSMYGASAHVMHEVLGAYAEVHRLPLPEPELTDIIPWQ